MYIEGNILVTRCRRCILPASFPDVHFEDGICNLCRNHGVKGRASRAPLGKGAFLAALSSENRDSYDCSVPVSGGKDSSYALYYISQIAGLRPLALFFDNGFSTSHARENVKRICDDLNVDLVVGTATPFRRKYLTETLKLSKNLDILLPLCTNCENALRSFAINETEKRHIPFIIWGSTDVEDDATAFTGIGSSSFRNSYGRFGNTLRTLSKSISMLRSQVRSGRRGAALLSAQKFLYYVIRDNMAMKAPTGPKRLVPFSEVSFKHRWIKTLYLYDYIPYDPYLFITVLRKETGWDAPSDREGKMDCRLAIWKDYRHLKKTGITATGFTMSVLVRDGKLDRDVALEREASVTMMLENECRRIARELGVNMDEALQRTVALETD